MHDAATSDCLQYKTKRRPGYRHGKLVVLHASGSRCSNGDIKWVCQCDCGTILEIGASHIGRNMSCGCAQRSNRYRPGSIHGKFTVLSRGASNSSGSKIINYKCMQCGETGNCSSRVFVKLSQSQVCKHGRKIYICGEITASFWNYVKRCAVVRNLDFSITPEYMWGLYEKQKGKCYLSGMDINLHDKCRRRTASFDRIDSKLGYVNGNVAWCHKIVNKMKMDIDARIFGIMCLRIYSNSLGGNVNVDI